MFAEILSFDHFSNKLCVVLTVDLFRNVENWPEVEPLFYMYKQFNSLKTILRDPCGCANDFIPNQKLNIYIAQFGCSQVKVKCQIICIRQGLGLESENFTVTAYDEDILNRL